MVSVPPAAVRLGPTVVAPTPARQRATSPSTSAGTTGPAAPASPKIVTVAPGSGTTERPAKFRVTGSMPTSRQPAPQPPSDAV